MKQENAEAAGIDQSRVEKRRAEAIARRRALRRKAAADAPKGPASIRAAANAAHKMADYDKALELWADFRRSSPDSIEGFSGAILAARSAGRDDLGKRLADEGALRFPDQAESFQKPHEVESWDTLDAKWNALMALPATDCAAELSAAQAPLKFATGGKRRFKVALSRVELVEERFPTEAKAYIAHVALLRKLNRLDRAAKLAGQFRKKFPGNQELALLHIASLDARKDFAGAFQAIAELRKTAKASAVVEFTYVQALARLGRLDDAEQACAEALTAFPSSSLLAREHAALATRRGDWTEALSRWQTAKDNFPNNLKIGKGLTAARMQLADQELPDPDEPQDEAAQLFARFESLGGTYGGCEFGIVQRKFGSMSLGVLRWATIGREQLTAGMHSGFEGLGEIENTQLKTYKASGGREEYIVSDSQYGLGSHTFIEPKDVPADRMLTQTAKRLKFLRGKLLEDLEECRKIFVYKFHAAVDDATIRSVFQSVRTRGEVTLLVMLKANDNNPKGSLRKLEDNLYAGYLGHFMSEGPIGENSFIDYMTWKKICTEMLAVHDASGTPQDAAP